MMPVQTCPCCGGPMGPSEAMWLGNCMKCDRDPGFWPFGVALALMLLVGLAFLFIAANG